MQIFPNHEWPENVEEAIAIQEQLRSQVITENQLGIVAHVAGVDVGYNDVTKKARAAVVVLSFPDLQLKEQVVMQSAVSFPYISGFLSFREIPAVLTALENLTIVPDLILCDGQGLAHPRRFGLACHLGVLTGVPTIGVAKTRFIGEHEPVASDRGSWQPLCDRDEIIGAALRTQKGVKPVYVSIGHKVNLNQAIDYVIRCTLKYRLPETTRLADRLTSDLEK
ncbi:endonuclease V [Oscillatoriales cyanobacterium USR001]|nr:endonuclease V [Oscillatoriales cyanobacterium USR001]